ncbi:CinA family nicotinamide mononucleotide deamidase-related protein [uncultured Bacteroides sp.]|uniref:CinA family nicotinamide mononucleotide deamidase-related protein n=1 Tax=uncultured Bacteroides sp. TaxID=162156 RepID=UPI002AAA9611|nr:CinA family nicotinamide mononucleotide deamidase-related protein [uncultured Bacteroides sp.]
MFVEIITIGDELLIGQVIDTNSAWMGKQLNNVGFEVIRVTSVRDREDEILEAVDAAMKRVDVVLMTGGLGPTKDDITKYTLCKYFGTELVFSEEVFENIKRILANRITMNPLNKAQALVPKDCTVINNKVGTASVSWFEKNGKVLVSMPGVPQEMKYNMSEEVIPRLCSRFKMQAIVHKTYTVKNYPESALAIALTDWENQLPECIKLAYLPKSGIVRLRLTGRGNNEDDIRNIVLREGIKLYDILGENVLDENDIPLEEIIGKLLKEQKLTLSTAESCTGGNIAARITSVPGCSAYFKGSVVAYSNEVKNELLQVSEDALNRYGAVSEEVVKEMVKGAMNSLKTDCAVAVSGIAGPDGGTAEKPVGTVWIAAAYGKTIQTLKQSVDFGRELNIERATNNALLLLQEILK